MTGRITKWTIGAATLTSIVEAETAVPADLLLPEATPTDVRSAGFSTADIAAEDGSSIGLA